MEKRYSDNQRYTLDLSPMEFQTLQAVVNVRFKEYVEKILYPTDPDSAKNASNWIVENIEMVRAVNMAGENSEPLNESDPLRE